MATRLESVHRFTVDEYERMAVLGILPDGPMELIEGRVLIGGRPWRFSTEDYLRLAEVGILGEDDHVELIEGEIVEMSPKGSRHSGTLKRLVAFFSERLGRAAVLSVQDPLDMGDGTQPEPDLMLLRPRPDFYVDSHPTPADVLLLIEVADTSLTVDRTRKADLYAAAGIPEYWVVDVERRRVFVHTGAMPTGYARAETKDAGDTLNVQQLDGFTVSGTDIFG